MNTQTQQALSKEFGLPIETLKNIAHARTVDDLHANGFGARRVYQQSPICKAKAYQKAGLTFEEGEAAAWAWIHENTKK